MKNFIENLNKARIEVELAFNGLPYGHTTLIKSLISLANPYTGNIDIISYDKIAKILTVKKAPGRAESGIPKKETIRSYLRSIEKQCPEDFKVISEGRKLQFHFPKLPAMYAKFIGNTEEYTVHNINQPSSKTIEKTKKSDEKKVIENIQEYTELYTEEYTPDSAVKRLYINNKINNNNNTLGMNIGNESIKKTISQNFYPSPDIIARAIAAGHSNATDSDIIQEFIDKNTAWGSTFADFNPIYLSFLAKHTERRQKVSITTPITQTRSRDNERASPKINSYDAALDAVTRINHNACKPTEELFPSSKVISTEFEHQSCVLAVGGTHQNIRQFISN